VLSQTLDALVKTFNSNASTSFNLQSSTTNTATMAPPVCEEYVDFIAEVVGLERARSGLFRQTPKISKQNYLPQVPFEKHLYKSFDWRRSLVEKVLDRMVQVIAFYLALICQSRIHTDMSRMNACYPSITKSATTVFTQTSISRIMRVGVKSRSGCNR
jgi:hypothetical protein